MVIAKTKTLEQMIKTEISNLLLQGGDRMSPFLRVCRLEGWWDLTSTANSLAVCVQLHYIHKHQGGPAGGSSGSVSYRQGLIVTVN